MDKSLHEMSTEELRNYIAKLNMDNINERPKIEKAEKILNAKLLEGLRSEINQLNHSLQDGITSNNELATQSKIYSGRMLFWTIILSIATVGLLGTGGYQMYLLHQYTIETRNLSKTAGEQLIQSRLDSAIVNRPYVEIRPIDFLVTGVKDPKDPTSVFCELTFEIKNYSDIPATNVSLEDFKIGSVSRDYLTPQNYPIQFKNICIYPKSEFKIKLTFVMNPDYHLKRYNNGIEDYDIYLKINYENIKDSKNKEKYWYSCNWKYSRRAFYIIRSDTDRILAGGLG